MSIVMKSGIDNSVNFVEEHLIGFLESRYVRREQKYFNCYLSSHTGCNRGCKFCHLTATGQTMFESSTPKEYVAQAEKVFEHYRNEKVPAEYVHFNFMARGEPLANEYMIKDADSVLIPLGELAKKEGVGCKFNISTIMPRTLAGRKLFSLFGIVHPTLYYSLYSMNKDFRNKWLPAALPAGESLDMLKEYQSMSKKIVKIHYAFINGANDSIEDIDHICQEIEKRDLICEFNVVRYNPFSAEQGTESPDAVIKRNIALLRSRGLSVKEIARVGFDVKASCGMFVQ